MTDGDLSSLRVLVERVRGLRVYVMMLRPFVIEPGQDEVYEIAWDTQTAIMHHLDQLSAVLSRIQLQENEDFTRNGKTESHPTNPSTALKD